jgi:hypothetical protein
MASDRAAYLLNNLFKGILTLNFYVKQNYEDILITLQFFSGS